MADQTDLRTGSPSGATDVLSKLPPAPMADSEEAPLAMSRAVRQVAATGRRKRQTPWVVAGILLVAGSALGFALWADAQSQRTNALVAAIDIPIGVPIERGHLREVSIGVADGIAYLPTAHLSDLIGQITQTAIPAGTLVGPSHVGMEFTVPPGHAVLGASLAAGAYPVTSLRPGDPVQLFEVVPNPSKDCVHQLLGPAEIWAVYPIDIGGEPRTFLSLLVAEPISGDVTNAASKDCLHVVLAERAS